MTPDDPFNPFDDTKSERGKAPGELDQEFGSYLVMGILFFGIPLTDREKEAAATLTHAMMRYWRSLDTAEGKAAWVSRVIEKLWGVMTKILSS